MPINGCISAILLHPVVPRIWDILAPGETMSLVGWVHDITFCAITCNFMTRKICVVVEQSLMTQTSWLVLEGRFNLSGHVARMGMVKVERSHGVAPAVPPYSVRRQTWDL